jgi:hypothetical protein
MTNFLRDAASSRENPRKRKRMPRAMGRRMEMTMVNRCMDNAPFLRWQQEKGRALFLPSIEYKRDWFLSKPF